MTRRVAGRLRVVVILAIETTGEAEHARHHRDAHRPFGPGLSSQEERCVRNELLLVVPQQLLFVVLLELLLVEQLLRLDLLLVLLLLKLLQQLLLGRGLLAGHV